MATIDQSKIRAFRLHLIVQNIGTESYCNYLEKKATDANFSSIAALLMDSNEKPKLIPKFSGRDAVYSPYDAAGNLKPNYPKSADIISLHKLHERCEILKKNSVPDKLKDWWNGNKGPMIFENILQNESCLDGNPGAACLVLYHVRNRMLPGPHKNEFSLDEETYSKAIDVVAPALKVLGDYFGKREDINKRIYEAKLSFGDKEYDEAAGVYKRDWASKKLDKGKPKYQ